VLAPSLLGGPTGAPFDSIKEATYNVSVRQWPQERSHLILTNCANGRGKRLAMNIILTPNQEDIIEGAIRSGMVRSVDEFIETAVKAFPQTEGAFDAVAAKLAVARIRDLRKGAALNRGAMSFRETAHIGVGCFRPACHGAARTRGHPFPKCSNGKGTG
jgi:hypothetical protein